VVIPLTTSSWMMLRRNLLYTGITRARKLTILAGSRRALAQAVRTPGAGRRHTALTHRLHPTGQANGPNARQRVRSTLRCARNGLPAQTARSTRSPPRIPPEGWTTPLGPAAKP